MDNSDFHIDDVYRQRFADHGDPTNKSASWDWLEGQLAAGATEAPVVTSGSRFGAWRVAAAVAAVFSVVGGWQLQLDSGQPALATLQEQAVPVDGAPADAAVSPVISREEVVLSAQPQATETTTPTSQTTNTIQPAEKPVMPVAGTPAVVATSPDAEPVAASEVPTPASPAINLGSPVTESGMGGITPRSWTTLAMQPSSEQAALVVPEGTMNAIVRAREESGAHVYQPLQKKARWLRALINRGSLSVMAGVNESRGFRNNGRKGDGSTDPLFGIAYDYQLSPQWALSVEATYVRRAGHFLEQSSRRESFLLTRKVQERQVINEVTSHFQFPVLAKWTMKEDHRFAVGVYGSVLANVTGQMRESEYYELDPDADIHGIALDTAIHFSSQSGYSEGLSKWDFGIVLGYEYQLFRSLNLGARYQRGLVDFADNRIYSSAGTTNNDYLSDLQLYLRVQLVN